MDFKTFFVLMTLILGTIGIICLWMLVKIGRPATCDCCEKKIDYNEEQYSFRQAEKTLRVDAGDGGKEGI
jgi:hypothetical protein